MTSIYPPSSGNERQMLDAWLDWHRGRLARKCAGLSAAQLRERSAPPSPISLLGLVRHMADVECGWFRRRIAGEDAPARYSSADNPDGDFDDVDGADVDEAFAAWHAECDRARQIMRGVESLDGIYFREGEPVTIRWTMVHMIEEYARHNGHADLLRERIDGSTGL